VTLKEVAAFERLHAPSKRWNLRFDPDAAIWDAVIGVVERFESDPEFTAPERLKEAERQLAEARVVLRAFCYIDYAHIDDKTLADLLEEARRALELKP
jgi:hypothetical protein